MLYEKWNSSVQVGRDRKDWSCPMRTHKVQTEMRLQIEHNYFASRSVVKSRKMHTLNVFWETHNK